MLGYFIHWPLTSLNCNPIDNVWRTLNPLIHRWNTFPTVNTALHAAMEEEWAAITPDELKSLTSFPAMRLFTGIRLGAKPAVEPYPAHPREGSGHR